jgi:hypothetical protein
MVCCIPPTIQIPMVFATLKFEFNGAIIGAFSLANVT